MNLPRALVVLLVGTQAACYTGPRLIEHTPQQYLRTNNPRKLWVTMNDGSKQVVLSPRVIADTVFGWDETGAEDLTIAISDMKELQAKRLAVLRTSLIPTAFVVAGVVVYTSVKSRKGEPGFSPGECEDLECDP